MLRHQIIIRSRRASGARNGWRARIFEREARQRNTSYDRILHNLVRCYAQNHRPAKSFSHTPGGVDTSIILRWLKDNYHAEIFAFCAAIGQEEGVQN
jgi:hypothetical protein